MSLPTEALEQHSDKENVRSSMLEHAAAFAAATPVYGFQSAQYAAVIKKLLSAANTSEHTLSADGRKDAGVDIESALSPDLSELSEIFCGLYAERGSGLICTEDERTLTLWKRLWIIGASGDTDKIILPSLDFPYEDEPIEFCGFEDLVPENNNVVYRNSFWLGVDRHPVPDGRGLGVSEMPLAVCIMVELINVLILMWSRFYRAFWGWTGTQAVLGLTAEAFAWLTMDTSRAEQDAATSRKHYDRCYRWLRWEAEKLALAARNDMELRGNYYVGLLLEEMIGYMLEHHFDVMPIFEDVSKMDEWRRLLDTGAQRDIEWTLDKVKGIRHKFIEGWERKGNV